MSAIELTPQLKKLFDQAMEWSHQPQKAVEKMRADALQDGTDPTEQIQQHMLGWIVNDDGRCLPLYINDGDIQDGTAGIHQQMLVSRLTYEVQLPELPEEVRQRAKDVLVVAQQIEIDNLDSYRNLRDQWFRKVHDYVRDQYHPQAL